jgi:hypothetical protein
MRQGASRHALKERGHDLYETPACCVTAAFRAGVFSDAGLRVWEPCAGRGAIARELGALGFEVTAQDLVDWPGRDDGIATGIDFLLERRAPEGVTSIVTNPPFKLADAFIRHGLTLVPTVIVLLRAMAIEGAGRADLIDGHLREYWIGIDRPPAMHREGWEGNRLSNSGAPFAWFVFSARPKGPHDPVALRRFRWRDAS